MPILPQPHLRSTIDTLLQGWQTGDAGLMGSVYSQAHQTALNYRLAYVGLPQRPAPNGSKSLHSIT